MRGVAGQWGLDVSVAGKTLVMDPSNTTFFQIIENIHQYLPSISFGFRDPSQDNNNMFNFKDGDPIIASIGIPDYHMYENREFAIIGDPRGSPNNVNTGVSVHGILNRPAWSRKLVDFSFEGNSGEFFSQLANAAGLTPIVDATIDKMIWLPNRVSLAEYGLMLADRAWASATSCFMTCVTDAGNALFRDIDKIIQGSSAATLVFPAPGKGEDGAISVLDYEVASKQQIYNNSRGYGSTSMSFGTDGSVKELNKIEMRSLAAQLPFGDLLVKAVGEVGNRVAQLVPLSGNTHDKWVEAQHQNVRTKSLYGYDIHVLTDIPTKVNLLDKVTFKPIDRTTGEVNPALHGDYIVTAKTKTIVGPRFYEKLVITSQGPNA